LPEAFSFYAVPRHERIYEMINGDYFWCRRRGAKHSDGKCAGCFKVTHHLSDGNVWLL
jgi:hypothetical protein